MKWFYAVALLATATTAQAKEPVTRSEYLEICRTLSNVAAQIMKVRQLGMPMSDAVEVVGGESLYESYVSDAYAVPRRQGVEEQQRATSDFRDSAYLDCFKGMPKGLPK